AAPRPGLLAQFVAIEAGLGLPADAVLRLAVLVVELPGDADRLRERLRLANEEHARLRHAAVRRPGIGPRGGDRVARAELYANGAAAYRTRVLVGWARSGHAPEDRAWRDRYALAERWQPPPFPLGGADVVAAGVPPGPRVGELLRAIEAWWIAGDF